MDNIYCCKQAEEDNSIYYDKVYNRYILEVETHEWDYYNDGYRTVDVTINYCPFCGKKLI